MELIEEIKTVKLRLQVALIEVERAFELLDQLDEALSDAETQEATVPGAED